jgi:predicted dehydrogenase
MSSGPLRFGILGAAQIAPPALVDPARKVDGVVVAAVAARDPSRAQAFAEKHGIPRVAASYEALVADPGVDAVYVALPNSHHHAWTIRALRAGKHVLCEKPFASNAAEAEEMAAVARETGRILVEAFHWRYHPLAARLLEILRGGELGRIAHWSARFTVPLLRRGDDIRFHYELAGGALMDLGCYPVSALRHLSGAEFEVLRATAKVGPPKIDAAVQAELRFPDGATGELACSMEADTSFAADLEVRGARGVLRVRNYLAPQLGSKVTLEDASGTREEEPTREPTYLFQLRAFAAAVAGGARLPTGADDAIRNMRAIDAIYQKAGLPLRGT